MKTKPVLRRVVKSKGLGAEHLDHILNVDGLIFEVIGQVTVNCRCIARYHGWVPVKLAGYSTMLKSPSESRCEILIMGTSNRHLSEESFGGERSQRVYLWGFPFLNFLHTSSEGRLLDALADNTSPATLTEIDSFQPKIANELKSCR